MAQMEKQWSKEIAVDSRALSCEGLEMRVPNSESRERPTLATDEMKGPSGLEMLWQRLVVQAEPPFLRTLDLHAGRPQQIDSRDTTPRSLLVASVASRATSLGPQPAYSPEAYKHGTSQICCSETWRHLRASAAKTGPRPLHRHLLLGTTGPWFSQHRRLLSPPRHVPRAVPGFSPPQR